MRNIFIIGIMVVSIGYMISLLATKYETIKTNSTKSSKSSQKNSK